MEPIDSDGKQAAHPEPRQCRCGYGKNHPWIRPVYHYGVWSQLAFASIFTPLPKRIDLMCPTCGEIVHSITDRPTLQRFRYHEPKPNER